MPHNMNRIDFFKKLGRYILLMLMAFIVMAVGKRVVTGSDCSECPGNGICRGESDCVNFQIKSK
jgi:hypothetical protein